MSNLKVIDTAALRAEREAEYSRLLTASCYALNNLRNAQDAYELGEGTLAKVRAARRALRKAERAADEAEIAAYGLEEKQRRDAKINALVAEGKCIEAEWLASPEMQKRFRDWEAKKKYGARPTQHAGFTIIDGMKGSAS